MRKASTLKKADSLFTSTLWPSNLGSGGGRELIVKVMRSVVRSGGKRFDYCQ